jgi:perosamine synthetase
LDTNWVSSVGPFVDRFESEIACHTGTRFGVATVNGTSALHIALLVAGVRPDEEVLVSTLTFIAPVNAIRYVGAWPVLVDAEAEYWQMDPQKVVDFLEHECRFQDGALHNRLTGRRVAAVLPVHILGHPVDMDPILEAAKRFKLKVIEDATEGLGAKYKGKSLGQLGDIACFSFNGNKIITTGGGGMIVTNNEGWAERAKYLTTQAKDDPVEYVHGEIGYNYRLTNMQAAMGCAQMEQLDDYVAAKRRIANAYALGFAGIPGLQMMTEAPWAYSTFWMSTMLVAEGEFGMTSRALLQRLAGHRVQTRPLWQPMHLSRAHKASMQSECKVSEYLNISGLSLPCSVGISHEEQGRVIRTIQAIHAERRSKSVA